MSSPGQDFPGGYEPIRRLGGGGSSDVWLARSTGERDRPVALKIWSGDSADPDGLEREFATLASLRHPNLIPVYSFGRTAADRRPWYSMEYIEGSALPDAVRRHGARLLIDVAAEALLALEFLHSFGILHCDLKSANLIVKPDRPPGRRLTLLDFGLAVQREESLRGGTLAYMAPELFRGERPNRRTDLYGLGAVLSEAMTGHPPEARDRLNLSQAPVVEVELKGGIVDSLPVEFVDWVRQLLSPDPADRPTSASDALRRLLDSVDEVMRPDDRVQIAARLASGSPRGRESQLEQVGAWLDQAGSTTILVGGDPGTGKTRLLRAIESDAVGKGRVVLALASAMEWLDRGIATEADERPLVLIDDLGDRGPAALGLIARNARGRDLPQLDLVATFQEGDRRKAVLADLIRDAGFVPGLHSITLGPLDPDGVRALVEHATGGSVSSERVQRLHQDSDGNPALLEAILLEREGVDDSREPRARLEASIERRLAGLTPIELCWMQTLAIVGMPVSNATLAAISGMSVEQAGDSASACRAAGLAVKGVDGWRAASNLIERKTLTRVDSQRVARVAGAAAEHIGTSSTETPAAAGLARLWSRAGETERSLQHATRAAEASFAVYAWSDAADWFRFAVCLLSRRDPRRASLRSRQATCLSRAGRQLEAARTYLGVARTTGTPAERVEAWILATEALGRSGRLAAADRTLQRAFDTSRETLHDDRALQARLLVARSRVHYWRGELDAHVSDAREALRALDGVDAPTERAQALFALGIYHSLQRDFDQARRFYLEAEGSCPGDDVELLASILVSISTVEMRESRFEDARVAFDRAEVFCREHSLRQQWAFAILGRTSLTMRQYRLDSVVNESGRHLDALRRFGFRETYLMMLGTRAECLLKLGRAAEARAMLTRALEEWSILGTRTTLPVIRFVLALCEIACDPLDVGNARDLLRQVLSDSAAAPRIRLGALVASIELAAKIGDVEEIESVWLQLEEEQVDFELHRDGSLLERVLAARARGALQRTEVERAAQYVRQALEHINDEDRFLRAELHTLLAECHEQRGNRAETRNALAEGRRILDEASECIEDPDIRRDFVDQPRFRALREVQANAEEEQRLLALYDMVRVLNSQTEPELLLESMLDMALETVRAERGMILLRDRPGEDAFSVRLARNLEAETIRDATQLSRRVVMRAGTGQSVLAVDTGSDERVRDLQSVSLYGIRSVLCVPLRRSGEVVGAVYLDSTAAGIAFTTAHLQFLEAFAGLAAQALHNARVRQDLDRRHRQLRAAAGQRDSFEGLIGGSAPMQHVYDLIERTAASDLPVLITGESGTGKELVAKAVHRRSLRRDLPFLTENCAAVTETLMESELFGHVKGAFTDADRDRDGLFHLADGGTLLLDEIGDMSPAMQARLLRVLQEGEVRRVGENHQARVDVRVLAATHRDLNKRVDQGTFRQDLLFRLQVLLIDIPPLRERPIDIPPLIDHFLQQIARRTDRRPTPIRTPVVELFERYSWPGNVRQLENTIQRLVVLADEDPITLDLVRQDPQLESALLGSSGGEALLSLKRNERDRIVEALRRTGGNRTRAAKLLGIGKATIFRKIKALEID